MRDALGRQIDYLRLSVTDRCDLRCVYCMPEVGVPLVGHADVLTVDETVRAAGLVRDAAGIRKIRITGGEPLVRRGLIAIVEGLSSLGFDELTLTTNGVLLGDHAAPLATAGVQRVNVSLDSLIDHRLAAISRRPLKLSDLEDSIRRAQKAGLAPVRINCVVLGGWNDDEIPAMLLWGERMGVTVRFIEHMPSRLEEDCLVPRDAIVERASVLGEVVRLPDDPGTAGMYRIPDRGLEFGVIAPFSDPMCDFCRRLRLTAEGVLIPCLAIDNGPSIRDMMRSGVEDEEIMDAVREVVHGKPATHGGCVGVSMWKIGG